MRVVERVELGVAAGRGGRLKTRRAGNRGFTAVRQLGTAGDGFFISFERPAQAIDCALAIVEALRPLELDIRASIHMGEVEVMGNKVGGIAVHAASRLAGEHHAWRRHTVWHVLLEGGEPVNHSRHAENADRVQQLAGRAR